MTRLKESDIDHIVYQMEQYDQELIKKTGHTLAKIAAHAAQLQCVDETMVHELGPVAVIPMTCGQGVIGGFSETVAGILTFLGAKAFVPNSSDAKGMAEALKRKAEVIFLADDDRFIAIHLKTGRYSDNSVATGKGYAAALDYLAGGLSGRRILLVGAGPVGCAAAFAAIDFGGKVHVYDKNYEASEKLANTVLVNCGRGITIEQDLDLALKNHKLIIDACPEAGFIKPAHLYLDSFVAAPGVPLGVHAEALAKVQSRLIHDPLQLGVATMLFDLVSTISSKEVTAGV